MHRVNMSLLDLKLNAQSTDFCKIYCLYSACTLYTTVPTPQFAAKLFALAGRTIFSSFLYFGNHYFFLLFVQQNILYATIRQDNIESNKLASSKMRKLKS